MLEKLNNINFNNISNNPNLGIEVGREIQNASWVKSPFFSITGTGADRGVRLFSVASQQPFRPRIKAQLTGSGVSGNTDFEANYDNLEILSQTIYPDAFGNSLRSKIKAYSELERIDFIKESVDSLTTWMNEERDKRIVASLTNDFTNYIYNDKLTEKNMDLFLDTKKEEVKEVLKQSLDHLNLDPIVLEAITETTSDELLLKAMNTAYIKKTDLILCGSG